MQIDSIFIQIPLKYDIFYCVMSEDVILFSAEGEVNYNEDTSGYDRWI